MSAAEVPDLGQLGQGADVEDRHPWAMGAQNDGNPIVLDVRGDDRKARIVLDQLTQSSGEEVVEVGEDDGSGVM